MMQKIDNYSRPALISLVAVSVLLALPFESIAAPLVPDAGTIERQQQNLEKQPQTSVKPESLLHINEDEFANGQENGVRLSVKKFHITGNTVYTEAELNKLLDSYRGRELSFPELQLAVGRISKHYRIHGYFVARAYLPAQDIKDGQLEIVIREGVLGKTKVTLDGRIKESTVTDIIHNQVAENDLLKIDKIERAILLVGDLAGINTRATLEPGVGSGLSDLTAEIKEGPLFSGSVDADNFGSRYTGETRVGFTGNLNDPSGHGDQATVRLNHGAHMDYGRVAYTSPVGSDGLKLGVSAFSMGYTLCCNSEFTKLDMTGNSRGWGINTLYPITRSQARNLNFVAGYEAKTNSSQSLTGNVSDRDHQSLRFELNGDHADTYFGGAQNNYGITWTTGSTDINNLTEKRLDSTTAHTDGGWNKVNLSAVRLQHITDRVTLYLAANAQYAPHNLDSSEKFTLGGVYGVRAYPQGEGAGDDGYLLNAELRWALPVNIPGSLQLAGFIDHGGILQHKNIWANWAGTNLNQRNGYDLSGVGLWLGYTHPNNFSLRATIATKIGSNAGQDASGNDSDGRDRSPRLWLQAAKYF